MIKLYERCLRCDRKLKDYDCKARGYGDICWEKREKQIRRLFYPDKKGDTQLKRKIDLEEFSENVPIVAYGKDEVFLFYRICPICGRFVKADEGSKMPEYLQDKPNATCKKCGRVQMPFCGWD